MINLPVLPLITATWQTIYMVFIASALSILLGLALGIALFFSKGATQKILGFVVNVTRSIPFIILMISIIPLTRLLVGTTIGTAAAMVPLTLTAIPFFARIVESALNEVPGGLHEAMQAMGATAKQTIVKMLIPESLPSLIRGATLTVISLVGYSAMAGAVGGGGLGELAINYGYQRFDLPVMIATIIILVIIVQGLQWLGDYCSDNRKLWPAIVLTGLVIVGLLAQTVLSKSIADENVLTIGVMTGPQQTVMKLAKKIAWQKYKLVLKIIPFDDYVLPNTALNAGDIDANIFQHEPYLNAQIKARGYKLKAIAKTFIYPMGFFSKKIKTISHLKNYSIIAIPNDPSNEARALLLLQKAGLIKLASLNPAAVDIKDITGNPLHLKFKLLDAAQLPRVFKDARLVALTNDFVTPAGFTLNQALLVEDSDSPYANVIVVRAGDNNQYLQQFIKVMHDPKIIAITQKLYPNGASVVAWS